MVRIDGDLDVFAERMRATLRSVDDDVPISQATSMEDVLDTALPVGRFQMNLVTVFAAIALFLSALGIYGVVAFTSRRPRPKSAFGWRWAHTRPRSCR